MTTIDTLKSLQKRIREATGPDRKLDLAISETLLGHRKWHDLSRYTTDPDGLGACVALQRAVLPGRQWRRDYDGDIFLRGGVYARPLANDCLTFLDAIVSALIAEEEAKLQEKAG